MKKTLIGIAMCATTPLAADAETVNENDHTQQILRATTQASMAGPQAYFSGQVRVDPLFPASDEINASGAYVSFEPGARSAWHTHPAGQQLVVISGIGLTQEWGKPVQKILPGDVIVCPAGVKHWHGAAPNSAMMHLAVTGSVDGKNVEWLEKVTDAEYRTLTSSQAVAAEALSLTQQAIPLIAASMATSDLAALDVALNRGLDAGLTVSETKEILVQLYAYVGFPRSLNALGELMKVVQVRVERGIEDNPGSEPTQAIPTGDQLLAVGKANQTKIAGAPVQGPLFDFVPVINQYLQTHLFGDIFARDNLDWQSRELATVAALAVTPGVEAQLRAHVAASLRVGLNVAQLRELAQLLLDHDQAQAAERVGAALDQHLASHDNVEPRVTK
ncbi:MULTISPECIES: (R)-mandelonitrile lyase [Pseudomonas]|uniref:Carboxymuconolactone decarboxylase n=1 Tax=Pseudomonas palleroniana TaxID=191390 RepID=A0A109FQK9_9PSED|nr:carboxymuconolactone decarboxylase family protein [Pseudomonas palleroniana]KWU52757.1 carboxymuconolactone decarboxylase [Pseudomonas palleroniana]